MQSVSGVALLPTTESLPSISLSPMTSANVNSGTNHVKALKNIRSGLVSIMVLLGHTSRTRSTRQERARASGGEGTRIPDECVLALDLDFMISQ